MAARGRFIRLILLITSVALLTACAAPQQAPVAPVPVPGAPAPAPAPANPVTPQAEWDKQLHWLGGSQGGSTYTVSVGTATVAAMAIPEVNMTVASTGGIHDTVVQMSAGLANSGAAGTDDLFDLRDGKGDFAGAKVKDLWTMYPVTFAPWLFYTTEDTGIRTLKDLTKPGVKVSMNTVGSGSELIHGRTLELLGYKIDSINADHRQAAEEILAGRLHAHAGAGFLPALSELALRKKIVIIGPTASEMDRILKEWPFFTRRVFDAGRYYSGSNSAETYSSLLVMVASSAVPDDVVYRLTKGVWENRGIIESGFSAWKDLQPGDILGVDYPVHPGAAKYYREIGLTVLDQQIGKR